MIRSASVEDASAIAVIYNHYIENTPITFETDRVSEEDVARRIEECQGGNLPWLVAVHYGKVIGYCYASKWKGRCAYRHSVEATVYLDPAATAKGWGTRLYMSLLAELESLKIHAVICGIALPNEASIALHEKLGMEKVAHFKEVGNKFGKWIDVGYWQCLINA
ncbi:N-acetyltransferase [Halomonas sp. ML-15]|uniref:arsinothricin resistance N-acetyltransferase ArsN1 family B n=1 Tax=Halomonas sp. ML-15 TaxID=2773305 RepID=UPI001746E1BB|nr:arsinothricin resistance N-acetyltransferase ArsN1 family B [Halomonas sp. ML-15]MBD3894996.1 N-acetyltransferase [Halomonas sp. ML-15]